MPFNAVDLIILVPVVAMAIKGLKNGLIHEVFGLIGQILAIFAAFTYMDKVGQFLIGFLGMSGGWVPLVSFILLYVVIIVLVNLLIKTLNAVVKFAFLSLYNVILGAIFSAFKAILVYSVILILLIGFNLPGENTRDGSLLYGYVLPVAPATYNVVAKVYPGVSNFTDDVGKYLDEFNPFNHFSGKQLEELEQFNN